MWSRNSTRRAPTSLGRVPFEQMAGAGDDLHRHAACGPRRDVGDREQLVLVAPQHQRRAGDAVEAAGLAAVAERPQQAGGGDVAEVAGDRAFLGAEVGRSGRRTARARPWRKVGHPLAPSGTA